MLEAVRSQSTHPEQDVSTCPLILAFFFCVQSRMDQAVDEAVKKALLESCEVNADKVRSWEILRPCREVMTSSQVP